jgi:predicted ATPase
MNQIDHLYVITGSPGSGKSTLIEALAASGIPSMPEAGRAIIQDQVAIGGDALPWSDRHAFAGTNAQLGNALLSGGAESPRPGNF